MKKFIYFMMLITTMVFVGCGEIETEDMSVNQIDNILFCKYKLDQWDGGGLYTFKEQWNRTEFTSSINGIVNDDIPYGIPLKMAFTEEYMVSISGDYFLPYYKVYEEDGMKILEFTTYDWDSEKVTYEFEILTLTKDELVLNLLPSKQQRAFYKDADNLIALANGDRWAEINYKKYGIDNVYDYYVGKDENGNKEYATYYYDSNHKRIPLFFYNCAVNRCDKFIMKYKKVKND